MEILFEKIKAFKYLKAGAVVLFLFIGVFIILFLISSAVKLRRSGKEKGQEPTYSTPTIKPVLSVLPTSFEELKKTPLLLQGTSIFFPSLYQNFIYYLSDAGSRFYKVSIDGRDKLPISKTLIATIRDVEWAPDKTLAVLRVENNKYFLGKNKSPFLSEEDENMATTNWLYDFQKQNAIRLTTAALSFSFSPSGKLYYIAVEQPGNAPPQSVLYSFDNKTSSSLKILVFPERQNVLAVVSDLLAISSMEPDPFIRNITYHLIDLTRGTVSKIPSPGNIYGVLPSQSGKYIASQKVDKDKNLVGISILDVEKKNFSEPIAYGDIKKTAWSRNEDVLFLVNENSLIRTSVPDFKTSQYPLPAGVSSSLIDDGSLLVSENNKSFFFTFKNALYNISF